jgi:hypothetical protein
METQPIPEIDVLIGTALWLHSNGWLIKQVSMAVGQKIDQVAQRQKLESNFRKAGISLDTIKFSQDGPDIEAIKGTKIWRIECKGLGQVRLQTLKNNFDRAVASVVSYYDQQNGLQLQLGLALPEPYEKLARNKLPQSLKEAINLWLFLYVAIDEIYEFAPTEDIPL